MSATRLGRTLLLALCLLLVATSTASNAKPRDSQLAASHQTLIICPFIPNGGDDDLDRGFYVQDYPGRNLGTVQVVYWTRDSGQYSVSMTARAGAYGGPIIGMQTIVVDLIASTYVTATYDFGGAPVIPGTTVAFVQDQVGGPGLVYYNTGPCGYELECTACVGVYQTYGTTPPLDTPNRRSVAVTITQLLPFQRYLPLAMR
jgi:hypothetical protein